MGNSQKFESNKQDNTPQESTSASIQSEPEAKQDIAQNKPENKPQENTRSARLLSLDVFRGITIVLMLLVNNIALDYATPKQLMHAPWNGGIRLADLVMPWFLFCVGTAIPFSAASFHRKNLPVWQYYLKLAKRMVMLVGLGILIDSSIAHHLSIGLGVLQLIGLAYFVGALLYELPLLYRSIAAAVLLVGYWAAIMFISVPGVGRGVFEEQSNLINHINATFLSHAHLAGLMSAIPTAALVVIATAVGDTLRNKEQSHLLKLLKLAAGGCLLLLIGQVWNFHLPFNKAVWTPSYILVTAGSGALVLGLLYLIVDVIGTRIWCYPFAVFGANAILAYVAPIVTKIYIFQGIHVSGSQNIQQWFLHVWVRHLGLIGGGIIYTASYILLWWIVLLVLYKKKVFLRV